jgi:ABC-2 type transport system permease protein
MTVVGIGVSAALFPGELNTKAFLMLNAGALFLFTAVSGICFFSSCLFNETKYSLALGAGIPVAFFLMTMLSEVGPAMAWLGQLSLFSLYDAHSIAAGDQSAFLSCLIYLVIGAALYAAGVAVFDRKDLPI